MIHTPGPWKIEPLTKRIIYIEIRPENCNFPIQGYDIAEVNNIRDTYLIAAAPDLLEAAKLGLYGLSQYEDSEVIKIIEKAVNKAEGKK